MELMEEQMNKPVFGLLLGTFLGLLDGASAWFYPEVRNQLTGIVIGSTAKGLITGLAIGFFSRKVNNVAMGTFFGLAVGALLAFLVAYQDGGTHYLEIMLPGCILGVIVGLATQKYPRPAHSLGGQ
jgi:ABC-type enterobactin transport system permease subunit